MGTAAAQQIRSETRRGVKVSICLPNLNNVAFIPERLRSILAQSFCDWEAVIVDGYSSDGAWELFERHAAGDPRLRVYQAPREGIYPAINRCITLSRGEYIYIATSDDTMPPDCLEKLVAALDSHPECDIAHCPLKVLDGEGRELDFAWDRVSVFARSSHGLLSRPHIRRAPYNGLLHLGGETVFNSLTQLLIRRSGFDRIGMFLDRWGSASDFNWGMRAGFLTHCVHVPNTWGGWRVHNAQATDPYAQNGFAERVKFEEMIDHAIEFSRSRLGADVTALLAKKRRYFFNRWKFEYVRNRQPTRIARLAFVLGEVAKLSPVGWHYASRKGRRKDGWPLPPIELVSRWVERLGETPLLELASVELPPRPEPAAAECA